MVSAIKKEELELNQLFKKNSELYQNHHHGVCILYETTFVYLIFKELLKHEYPFKIYWEFPYPDNKKEHYPDNKKEHCDIGLIRNNGDVEALIEFKIWTENHDRKIKADILKLQKVTGCKKYIVILGYGGDIHENHDYLMTENPSLHLIGMDGLTTNFFKVKEDRLEANELNVFMYEIKEI